MISNRNSQKRLREMPSFRHFPCGSMNTLYLLQTEGKIIIRLMEVILEDGKRITITKNSSAVLVDILNKLLDPGLINRVVYY